MKKIIFIVSSVLIIIVSIFYFGINLNKQKYHAFISDGYVISRTETLTGNKSTKYYFTEGTKYKKNYNNNYVFKNSDGDLVEVPSKAFVHYSDDTIATLDKTSILDLKILEQSVLKYYNFYVGSIINKSEKGYVCNILKEKIYFNDFIMKISDDKYMVVSKNIKVIVGNEERKIEGGYLEIQFFDGNIVRLENQELQLQNISSNFYIEILDVKINLSDKNIFYKDKKVANLSQIIIDSSDNIDIPVEENNSNEEESKKDNPLEGLQNGILPGNDTTDNEEEINENERVQEPNFMVVDMQVTPNKFRAEIEYDDVDNMLVGGMNLKIIETGTNKIVYQRYENTGLKNFNIEVENLNPETNYVFVVNSNYSKEGINYNRDFIQKSFMTEAVGIDITKNYFTTDSLSFNIIKYDYSDVSSVEVALLDSDNHILQNKKIEFKDQENIKQIDFIELDSNTNYQVTVYNFLYNNSIIADQFSINNKYKTLKQKPTIGGVGFTIDKKNSLFTLQVNNVYDNDNGIVSYRYEIYDARTLLDNPVNIKTFEKNTKGSVDLSVDDVSISRGVPYTFKVVTIFDDNEKQYEYQTEYSDIMQMDGVEFPSVRFEGSEITFERIRGNILITDNGNTINFSEDNIITIVYTDSVGNSKSLTYSGNSNIPFYANNLRANETYTISVYTKVNLQDGNLPIDNCFIGSMIVKTEPTKPFVLNSDVDTVNTSNVFLVKARLGSENEIDNTLEANTLTGLTFSLYSGKTTNGTLIKKVRKVDRDIDPYVSELKTTYYDQTFQLDPSFFGLKNQDLSSEYYTIAVTDAYDYTTYQNQIEVKSNVITIKTNGYIPDLPEDINDAVEIIPIRNKDGGAKYDASLQSGTIIGYKVKPIYDNSKKYAKYIDYSIYNADNDNLIMKKRYTVPESGLIDYEYFYIGYGTSNGIVDKDFRRGNNYYITYTIELDLNFDGIAETVYPLDSANTVLRSKTISAVKQQPIFKLYPSTYKDGSAIWKYNYTDVDNALYQNRIYYKLNSQELGSVTIAKTQNNQYNEAAFNIKSSGNLALYINQVEIKSNNNIISNVLVNQNYEVPYVASNKEYTISLESNRIIISLTNYDATQSFYKRVAAAKIVFKTASETIVKDNLLIDESGMCIIDLSEIESMMGYDITTEVYLYYDNGITGYDTVALDSDIGNKTNKFAMQIVNESNYYSLSKHFGLRLFPNANSSIFEQKLTFKGNLPYLNLNNLIYNQKMNMELSIGNGGLYYNYEYLFPKQLSILKANCLGTNSFKFDMIVPGVSLLDSESNLSIYPGLSSANIDIDLYGNGEDRIKNNKIFIEIYETDSNGILNSLLNTVTVDINNLKNIYIDGLSPKTNYFIKILAYIKKGESYEKVQLYDIDFNSNNKLYYFKTLGSIGINNIQVNYYANNYQKKYLNITYNIEEIVGYDRISYEIYHIGDINDIENTKTKMNFQISDDYIFNKQMTKSIQIFPDPYLLANENYLIEIKAYADIKRGDRVVEVELEPGGSEVFYFLQLRQPYIGISSNYDDGSSINYRVSIYDYQKVIVNDCYYVKMYDENLEEITPDDYADKCYSSSSYNQSFKLENLSSNKEYTLEILYKTNVLNGTNTIVSRTKKYTIKALDNDGIDIGQVHASTNLDDQSKVNLIFYDSYKLSSITSLRYSIYSANGYAIDNEVNFTPILDTSTDNPYYIFTLSDSFIEKGTYYMQLQFISNDKVISEETLQYNYV